jgi:hypothetical protein
MHKIPLTELERSGLKAHGLDIGTPSQLSDVFRQGMKWAQENDESKEELLEIIGEFIKMVKPLIESVKGSTVMMNDLSRLMYPEQYESSDIRETQDRTVRNGGTIWMIADQLAKNNGTMADTDIFLERIEQKIQAILERKEEQL